MKWPEPEERRAFFRPPEYLFQYTPRTVKSNGEETLRGKKKGVCPHPEPPEMSALVWVTLHDVFPLALFSVFPSFSGAGRKSYFAVLFFKLSDKSGNERPQFITDRAFVIVRDIMKLVHAFD